VRDLSVLGDIHALIARHRAPATKSQEPMNFGANSE
jgi:hypothetical protein